MNTTASHVSVPDSRHHRRARANRYGAVLIEFALILPVLVAIVLAAIDFGRFAHSHIAVTNSARVGAGYACMHPYTTGTEALWQTKIREAVRNEMQGVRNYDNTLLTMTAPLVTTDSDGQKRVRIEVTYPFQTLVNWPLAPKQLFDDACRRNALHAMNASIVPGPFPKMTTKFQIVHRRTRQAARRRGAAMIETAFILIPLLILTVGLLDFAVGIYRYHILSESSRQLARNAIVHGQFADRLGQWGPTTYTAAADASNAIANSVRPYLVGIDPAAVSITVEWPQTTNEVEKSVRTTLTTAFHPLFTSWFGSSITLRAQSEMKIAH